MCSQWACAATPSLYVCSVTTEKEEVQRKLAENELDRNWRETLIKDNETRLAKYTAEVRVPVVCCVLVCGTGLAKYTAEVRVPVAWCVLDCGTRLAKYAAEVRVP